MNLKQIVVNGQKLDVSGGSGGVVNWENVNGRPDLSNVSSMTVAPIVLNRLLWTDNQQTMSIEGILEDEKAQLIIPIPTSASEDLYKTCGIKAVSQSENTLVFEAATTPTEDVNVIVYIIGAVEVKQEFVGTFEWWSPEMTSNNTPEPFAVTYTGSAGNSQSLGGSFWELFAGENKGTWMLNTNTQTTSITIDLGKNEVVDGFRMKNAPQRQDLALASGDIYGSTDGLVWDLITNVHTTVGSTDFDIFNLDHYVKYRYFKLSDITPTSGNSSVCLWDFYFHKLVLRGGAS